MISHTLPHSYPPPSITNLRSPFKCDLGNKGVKEFHSHVAGGTPCHKMAINGLSCFSHDDRQVGDFGPVPPPLSLSSAYLTGLLLGKQEEEISKVLFLLNPVHRSHPSILVSHLDVRSSCLRRPTLYKMKEWMADTVSPSQFCALSSFLDDEVNLLVIVVDANPIWWGKQALLGSEVRHLWEKLSNSL